MTLRGFAVILGLAIDQGNIMLHEWDKNSEGNVWVTPLLRHETAVLYETGVGLRLEVSPSPAAQSSKPSIAQVAMTVEQAEELITDLQLAVDRILFSKPPGAQTN